MDLSAQLCVAESSTKVPTLPPARRLDLGRDLSFSLLPYSLNGLLIDTAKRFGYFRAIIRQFGKALHDWRNAD